MDKIEWLPLGTVVTITGGIQKLIIVGRGLSIKLVKEEEPYYFDYSGVLYPIGAQGDDILYFNHDKVDQVLFKGYDDDDNRIINNCIDRFLADHPNIRRYVAVRTNAPQDEGEK